MGFWKPAAFRLLALTALARPASALDWKTTELTATATPFQITVDVVFPFANSSRTTVNIRNLETSCNCVSAAADKLSYRAGEAGEVRASFAVGDHPGLFERVITVTTDEPGDPVHLILRVDVPAAATCEPRRLNWSHNGATIEQSLELTVAPGLEINFTVLAVTSEDFTARLETVTAGHYYRLFVKPRATARPATAAIRLAGHEKSGHDLVVSAYANVE